MIGCIPTSRSSCNAWSSEFRDGKIGKLDEQIILLVYGVFRGIPVRILKIIEIQMEVAARHELKAVAELRFHLLEPLPDEVGHKRMSAGRVRGRYDVRNAVDDGRFSHFERDID